MAESISERVEVGGLMLEVSSARMLEYFFRLVICFGVGGAVVIGEQEN